MPGVSRVIPVFDATLCQSLIEQRQVALGQPLVHVARTASTNDLAWAHANEGAPHGLVVHCDEQTQGRGRHGRTWFSGRLGENLLFSVLLRPRFSAASCPAFSLAVGLAVRDAVQKYLGSPALVKWSNDVYAQDNKIAGVLVESQFRGSELVALVVGIGINVNTEEFPKELAGTATSLLLAGAGEVDRERLLVDVLEQLATRVTDWENGNVDRVLSELRRYDLLKGRLVRVGGLTGTAMGIDDDGALLVARSTDGTQQRVTTGTVELLSRGGSGQKTDGPLAAPGNPAGR